MAKIKQQRKRKHYNLPTPGASPGLVLIEPHALLPKILLHRYDSTSYQSTELKSIKNLNALIKDDNFSYWLEIKGFNDIEMFDSLQQDFNINKLVIEDITSHYQRPKFEEYETYDFAVSRILYLEEDNSLANDQLSFLLNDKILITLEENYEDCFSAVRQRLAIGKGSIRTGGPSYLMYALMDMLVDQYFSILGEYNDQLDIIEDRMFDKPHRTVMYDTQLIKRNLMTIRRVIWPERDKMNDMLRSDSKFIAEKSKIFLKDTYDHCIQVIDIVESLKEIAASNLDMYLSIISNRMNEIMKVLTIISSIFIPLTFIAGIYGMNFSRVDPITGNILQQNMPELYQEHGYLYTILVMVLIALFQIIYFWRKGWFK